MFAGLFLPVTYCLLYAYHYNENFCFDYAVMRDNFHEIFYADSVPVILGRVGVRFLVPTVIILFLLVAGEVFFRLLSRQKQQRPYTPKFLLTGILYLGCILAPVASYDDGLLFFKSIYRYYYDSSIKADYVSGTYPFIRHDTRVRPAQPAAKPNVFIILLESFNGFMPETHNENNEPYTPYFNSLIPQGIYVERFYGNSVQTSKGHLATLFSMVPSVRGKVYVNYADNAFLSLPRIFENAGYETVFFQAYKDLTFDNTKPFLLKNGIQHIDTVTRFLTPEDQKFVWGWGAQDNVFYRKFFTWLDRLHTEQNQEEPFFAVLATIGNHGDFDQVPPELRAMYPSPRNKSEWYANSLRLSDSFLEVFFEELAARPYLQNSIIVITGDHSVPNGRHGLYGTESGSYEEFFRTPLLILWPGYLKPERIKDIPYSQVDIAPTVADLAGVYPEVNHFEGTSVFRTPRSVRPVYLIQPYSGQRLSVVRYPFKYTRVISENTEELYNLAVDPMEERDLAHDPQYKNELDAGRRDLKTLFYHQAVLSRNEIWK